MKIVDFSKERSGQARSGNPKSGGMKILEFSGDTTASRTFPRAYQAPPPAAETLPETAAGTSDKPAVAPRAAPIRNVRPSTRSLRMQVLDLGKLRLDKNFMVANSTIATVRSPNPPGQLIDIPVSAYYIEHPDGNVLFDTGCNPDWGGPNGRWPAALQELFPVIGGEDCYLPARLDAMGLGTDQIRHVVLSHLHCDHAGCVEYFRKSNLIVHEDEFASAATHHLKRIHTTPYALKDIETWMHLDLNWHEVGRHDPDHDIVDGVKLLNFGPGHSVGMLGLYVNFRDHADVILASDACYTSENFGPPYRPAGISYDSIGSKRTVQRIRALSEHRGAEVWFGHDIPQFASLRKGPDEWYE